MHSARPMILMLVLALGATTLARASDLRGGVSKLFESGAKNTPTALAAAKAQYEQLKRPSPNDQRIDYAYALVLVNQHKYHDALPLLSRYLETGKGELNTYCLKMWVQIQDRRYSEALDEAVALSQRITKNPKPNDESRDAARYLGTVFGYLELARPAAVKADLRMSRRQQVLTRLGKAYTPAFDEGRDAVAEQLSTLQSERTDEIKQAAATVQRRQQDVKTVLDKDTDKIAAQKKTIQSSADQLQEAEREWKVLQTQLTSLQADRTQLSAQIITTQAQMTLVQPDYFNSVTSGRSYANSSVAARAQLNSLAITLARLNKQAFDIDRKILGLQARGKELNVKGAHEAETLAESEELAAKTEKRAKALEKTAARKAAVPPTSAKATAITGKIASFATYAPFPYEAEQKRVLGWFAK